MSLPMIRRVPKALLKSFNSDSVTDTGLALTEFLADWERQATRFGNLAVVQPARSRETSAHPVPLAAISNRVGTAIYPLGHRLALG